MDGSYKPGPDAVLVTCRLCGEPWKIPLYIAREYGPDRGYECPYCKRRIKQGYHLY